MKCKDCRGLVERYLDRELTPEQQAQVEQHLKGCADCHQFLTELKGLDALLRSQPLATRPESYWQEQPVRFWEELRRRRRSFVPRPERRFPTFVHPRIVAVAAAALLLVAVGIVGLRSLRETLEPKTRRIPEVKVPVSTETARVSGGPALPAESKSGVGTRPVRRKSVEPEQEKPREEAMPKDKEKVQSAPPIAEERTATATGRAVGGATSSGAETPPAEFAFPSTRGSAPRVGGATPEAPAPKPAGLAQADKRVVGAGAGGKAKVSKTAEEAAEVRAEDQAEDTTIYGADRLGSLPKLVFLPEASDELRREYGNQRIPIWVVVEKDGSVSRAEVRAASSIPERDASVQALAQKARFLPGQIGKRPVRSTTVITVQIKASTREKKE